MFQPQSSPRGNVVGERSGVLAHSGQERRIQLGQPLQAEKIQSGYVGDAMAVNRLAVPIQHRNVDPAEINAVTRGPDHRADAGGGDTKAPEWFGEAERIR